MAVILDKTMAIYYNGQVINYMKKKVLVTGGAGFIGSQVVRRLLNKKYQVRIADNLSKPGHENLIEKGAEFIRADLSEKKQAESVFSGMDYCINLAAKIGGIGYFHQYPATILSENNKIYSNTFEAAVKNKIQRLVYVSSSMVFESTQKFPAKEEDVKKIPSPVTSYGMSKLVGEWYCRAFWDEYRLPFSICRPFNAYGINEFPGDEVGFAHVIPDLIKKILKNEQPLKILGDGKQTRCFTHVSDIASGIVAVMESRDAINEDFNISSPEEININDLAQLLYSVCGKKGQVRLKHVKGFPFDIKRRLPDTAKAKRVLGWSTNVPLRRGLTEVVYWLKSMQRQGKL